MIVEARHCKHCQGVFLPAQAHGGSSVQCPHCSGQMTVAECPPADVARVMPEQEYHPVMEDEARERAQALRHDQWMGRLLWSCGTGAALVAALIAWQRWGGDGEQTRSKDEEIAALTEADKALQRERAAIESVVRRILGAKSMEELLPDVAGASHVRELIAWHLNHSHPLMPEELARLERVDPMDVDGKEIRRVGLSTARRPVVWMVMSREDGSWKLNWELYSNAHIERWHSFLRGDPGSTVELPLLAVKKPAPEAFIVKAGGSPGSDDALTLRAGDSGDFAAAVLPRNSPVWKELPGIGYDDPENRSAVKFIARVSLLDPGTDPPLVRLDEVIQRGWVRGTQKPVARKPPPQ